MKFLKLSGGQETMVDDDVYLWAKKIRWHLSVGGYARHSNNDGSKLFLHREIMKTPKGKVTDHVDGNKLNNLRSNLRCVSGSINSINVKKLDKRNTTGFKGVRFFKKHNTWEARIMKDYKSYRRGTFKTREEAALAYNEMANQLYGENPHFLNLI